jgi:hypothetical protein
MTIFLRVLRNYDISIKYCHFLQYRLCIQTNHSMNHITNTKGPL